MGLFYSVFLFSKNLINRGRKRNPWEESDDELDQPKGWNRASFSASEPDDESSAAYSGNFSYPIYFHILEADVNGISEDNISTASDFDSATQDVTEATCSQIPPDMFCPWLELPPERIPALELPGASMDLLIDSDHILHTLEVIYYYVVI